MDIPGLELNEIVEHVVDIKYSNALNEIDDEEERKAKRKELVEYYLIGDGSDDMKRQINNILNGSELIIEIIENLRSAVPAILIPGKIPQIIVKDSSLNSDWGKSFLASIKPGMLANCGFAEYVLNKVLDSCEQIEFEPPSIVTDLKEQIEDVKNKIKAASGDDEGGGDDSGGDDEGGGDEGGGKVDINIDSALSPTSTNPVQNRVIYRAIYQIIQDKQDKLVSGRNIKTINGEPILGNGNIEISGGGSGTVDSELNSTSTNPVQNKVIKQALDSKQATLRSGTNIKTINGYPLLGEGNITIPGGSGSSYAVQLQGTDATKSVKNTYTDYNLISGAITKASDVPTLTDTGSYSTLAALIEGEGYSTTMNPDFILDMVSDGAPFFYVAYYKVVSFSLEVYYYKVTSSSLFSSFTDYILGSTAKTYCLAFEGVRDYYYWDGSAITKNPTSSQTIKFLDGASIMKAENTIYEIVGDIDLNGTVITPAAGSIIKFAGGRIKNGTIDGQNGINIDCPDVIFFENMRFRKMVGEQVFKDTWFTDVFDEGSMKGIPHLTLSRNYDITVESMLINKASIYNSYAPHDKLILEGNGHILKLPTQMCKPYKVGTAQFINTRYIEVYDLTITLAESSFGKLQVVFDTNIGIFHNVKFNGSCRFAAAYTNSVPTDVYGYFGLLPQLQFYGCDIRVPTFAVEGPYNQVIARDSVFARSTPDNSSNTIFSIAPCGRNDYYVNNSFVDMEGCYMEGGWETPNHGKRLDNGDGNYTYYYTVSGKDTNTYTNNITYNKVRFKSCELVFPYIGYLRGFSTTAWTDQHSGTTSLAEYEDCIIHTGLAPGRFYTDNLVFRRCKISLMHNNSSFNYPCVLHCPIGSLEFSDCVFDSSAYTAKSGRSWTASKTGGLAADSDKAHTHFVLCITEYPSDNFKVILKNNTFIEGQYRNKIDIYCDASSTSGSTLADRVECSGNRYAFAKPRMMQSGYRDSTHAPWSSAYGKITEGYWSTPTTNMLLPIEHTSFRGSESMSDFSFAACTHDFDFSIGNIYSTSVATAYYIFDALRAVARKLKFDE